MAQGKARDKEATIELLKPYFKLGCSVTKACNYGGIPQSTVQTWIDADEELRLKITLWQNEPNVLARTNWIAKMAEGDYNSSKDWISKREKDEFSDRVEATGADGKDLPAPVLVQFLNNDTEGNPDTSGV
jgi:hypothetical protein